MKKIYLLLIMAATFITMGCSSDDKDDRGSTYKEAWYIPEGFISDQVAGLKKEINYWIQKGYTDPSDYFSSEGMLMIDNYYIPMGVYNGSRTAIHILDNKTLQTFGNAFYCRLGSNPSGLKLKQLLFTVDLGPIVGKVGCYAQGGTYYNYTKTEDGFWISNYDTYYEEFMFRDGKLIPNGGGAWVEFDPNAQY